MATEDPDGGVDLLNKAMQQLADLMEEASRRGVPEAACGALATADKSGRPSVRTIYLASIAPGGVAFFTDIESGKGRQLLENPRTAVCLFWPQIQQQVTVEGDVEILGEADSDDIWRKRPRDSRLAAWVTGRREGEDGSKVPNRERWSDVKQRYSFEQVPRPPRWRAFFIHPDRIEFWETGWHRLRPRVRYLKHPEIGWSEQAESL